MHIQAADIGDMSGSGNLKFCLWKAFLSDSQYFGAGVVIPNYPNVVSEVGTLSECSM